MDKPCVVILAVVLLALWTRGSGGTMTQEICQGEILQLDCPASEIIVLRSAKYGRMKLGRCVKADLGFLGCETDVLSAADKWCSGQQTCQFLVTKATMEEVGGLPCYRELITYLDIEYECAKAIHVNEGLCSTGSSVEISPSSGILSSHETDISGCGSPQSPWRISAKAGQRVRISLINFGWTQSKTDDVSSSGASCDLYGFIVERGLGINKTLCGGFSRESQLYTSMSSNVEIQLLPLHLRKAKNNFLINYQVIGCTDINPPANSWYKRDGNSIEMGCNTNHNSWNLVCEGDKWTGVIGNCTETVIDMSSPTDDTFYLSPTLSIIVIAGLAGLVVVLLFAIGMGYMCFNRKKKKVPTATLR